MRIWVPRKRHALRNARCAASSDVGGAVLRDVAPAAEIRASVAICAVDDKLIAT